MTFRSITVIFVIVILQQSTSLGQTYIADTIYANFIIDQDILPKHAYTFTDKRDVDHSLISLYEKKKWLFFPVDQVVLSEMALDKSLEKFFNIQQNERYHIDIHEFYLKQTENMFNRTLSLNAAFQLYKSGSKNDSILVGAFYYEESSSLKKKTPINEAYTKAINNFKSELTWDLNAVCSADIHNHESGKNHFRAGQQVASKNFYVGTDILLGYNFWGFDAEIFFSAPEPAQSFKRKSKMVRFLNFENRQSVGFSSGNYFNYRWNENLLLQNKSCLLLGFNKWNDIDEAKRTLEEILLFQLSMTQKISFNKLDKSGLVFGVGFFEELSYVIYNNPIISLGGVFNCTYKF